jgi:thioredoxin reductase (NADPH)
VSNSYEIVVVGGGIAGLTAGLTAARLGRSTLVLTGDVLGGHLLNIERIDGFPGFADGVPGYDLCPIAQEQAAAAGAEFSMTAVSALDRVRDAWQITTRSESYSADTVIVATGTELRLLDVPGETLLRGKGVSQCASCDAPLLRGQGAVVAGGGDSALQEALTLAEHCSSVTIVHHGAELTAQAAYIAQAEAQPKITRLANSEVAEIIGAEAVETARIRNTANGEASDINCAAVFGFIGLTKNTALLRNLAILDGAGAIETDAAMRTALPGLLAAGTVRAASTGRAAAAAGDGASAALAADRYLTDGQWRSDL